MLMRAGTDSPAEVLAELDAAAKVGDQEQDLLTGTHAQHFHVVLSALDSHSTFAVTASPGGQYHVLPLNFVLPVEDVQ